MFTITTDDRDGVIVVVGCILMTWTLLCFMIRMYNRFTIRASLGLDDFTCGLATVRASTSCCDRSMSSYLTSTRQSESHKRSWCASQYLTGSVNHLRYRRMRKHAWPRRHVGICSDSSR
jgi:hypothetical protein